MTMTLWLTPREVVALDLAVGLLVDAADEAEQREVVGARDVRWLHTGAAKLRTLAAQVHEDRRRMNMSLGARIRAAREAAGLTVEQAAERAEMATQNWHRLERDSDTGRADPRISTVRRVAQALGVTLDLLVWGEDGDEPV
jgi:DNA-binding XRE family transcriptional regulator